MEHMYLYTPLMALTSASPKLYLNMIQAILQSKYFEKMKTLQIHLYGIYI